MANTSSRALRLLSLLQNHRFWPGAELAGSWDPARAGQAAVDSDVVAGTALACRDAERIRFGYVAAGGERTERHVEPHRLVVLDRRWYLVGYDLTRNDWRSFRLDRLAAAPQPTGARFRPRSLPAADAADFVRSNIAAAPRPGAWPVEAVVEAPAALVRERLRRWATVEEAGPNRCRVFMTAEDNDWPVIALGLTGAEFRVLAPPELAERVADWGARFVRAAERHSGLTAQWLSAARAIRPASRSSSAASRVM
jgi:predicted DNA-binding transcriptional regulator YafY